MQTKIIKPGYYERNDKRGDCVCGHNHIEFVECLGKDEDEEGYALIPMCCSCDCESFKKHSHKNPKENKNE